MAIKLNSGVYAITSPSGGQYVGSAVDFDKRWRVHRCHLRAGTHHSAALQAAWAKYGEGAMVFAKLVVCQRHLVIMYEQVAIDALAPRYNMCPIAGNTIGLKQSLETVAKRVKARAGYRHSEETKVKMRATLAAKKNADI